VSVKIPVNESMAVEKYHARNGPLVSVLLPTYNRRRYLPTALGSVVRQEYRNLEIIVIRDGGENVRDLVEAFRDPRIVLIDRDEHRGVPFTLNQGLSRASGKYVCYLGDDDLFYPDHVGTLVDTLENRTDCGVAYSDLYRVYCRIEPDGGREVLGKVVEVSRDFDRFVMLFFNHVLHVSLMHRRDLIDKIGFHNERLTVLLDWELTRKLCFFTDFYHVHRVTGEYYCPVGRSDRVSVRERRDKQAYLRNVMTIRTTRPPKPWPKMHDVSIVLVTERLDRRAGSTLAEIWRHTFYPYEVYLPLRHGEAGKLDCEMPNVVTIECGDAVCPDALVDAALQRCAGDYVAVVPSGFPVREFWLEDSLHALLAAGRSGVAFELEGSQGDLWAVVLAKEDLADARQRFADSPVRQSLTAAGVETRVVEPQEIPFQFDQLLCEAEAAERRSDWARAGQIYEHIGECYANELWMKSRAGRAYLRAGRLDRAGELVREVNACRPTVETLLTEARVKRARKDFTGAIALLEKAEQILSRKEAVWT